MSSPRDDINSDDHIDELQNLKITNKSNFPYFIINACSLSKIFDGSQHLLSCTSNNFEIIAITETTIIKNFSITNNINIKNFSIGSSPTEFPAGGTLLHIVN